MRVVCGLLFVVRMVSCFFWCSVFVVCRWLRVCCWWLVCLFFAVCESLLLLCVCCVLAHDCWLLFVGRCELAVVYSVLHVVVPCCSLFAAVCCLLLLDVRCVLLLLLDVYCRCLLCDVRCVLSVACWFLLVCAVIVVC